MNHIKGALNIPVWDLEFYLDFLKDKEGQKHVFIFYQKEIILAYLVVTITEKRIDNYTKENNSNASL